MVQAKILSAGSKAAKEKTVATFGGAWSNHIIATAYACKEQSLESVGIIRGEKPPILSHTLQTAEQLGMHLKFISRDNYKSKDEVQQQFADNDWYWISEGGYGKAGAKGAGEIAHLYDLPAYTHIIAPVGTGTMLSGLIMTANKQQQVVGISSMKNNNSLKNEIIALTGHDVETSFELIHDYHFGGFGKHSPDLIDFINQTWHQHQLPLDIVYTGKTFYAIKDLVEREYFPTDARLLMIHSGGLQGNKSLGEKVLAF